MHIEIPKVSTHSFKEFAKHYLMIVLSILTALGLEAWIEHTHHEHAAASASAQIENELRGALADVRSSLKTNEERFQPMRDLDAAITKDIREGVPAATINQHIQARKDDFGLSLNWPVFASQAWDVSVANQSASWVDAAKLRQYSAAYAELRDAASWMTHDSTITLDAPHMSTLRTRVTLGMEVDPVEYLVVLRQMINVTTQTQSHLRQLEAHLVKSVPAIVGKAQS
ncbi:hypothetical protein [Dyella subtropica]|uniref:hypothetical protein n=1 Tax=Dyella subtropica TaxID=2992127 RepID=UPI002253BA0F|nr:hypothetical protein [Dyella subtropica]